MHLLSFPCCAGAAAGDMNGAEVDLVSVQSGGSDQQEEQVPVGLNMEKEWQALPHQAHQVARAMLLLCPKQGWVSSASG